MPAGTMMPSADGASTGPASPVTRTSTVAATAVGFESSTRPLRPRVVAPATSQRVGDGLCRRPRPRSRRASRSTRPATGRPPASPRPPRPARPRSRPACRPRRSWGCSGAARGTCSSRASAGSAAVTMSAEPTEEAVVAAAASSPSVRIGPGQTRCCRLSAGCTSTDGASARCSGHGTSAAAATVATASAAAATNPAARPPMRSARFRSMRIVVSLRRARRGAVGGGLRAVLVVVVVRVVAGLIVDGCRRVGVAATDSACASAWTSSPASASIPRRASSGLVGLARLAGLAACSSASSASPGSSASVAASSPLGSPSSSPARIRGRHLGAILRSRCAGRPGRRGDHPPRGCDAGPPVRLASGAGRDRQQERRADARSPGSP